MMRHAILVVTAASLLSGCTVFRQIGLAPRQPAAIHAPAETQAALARTAMKKRDAAKAIVHAEAAVAADGQDPALRTLLGSAYLRGGRFASAAQAFGDSLALRPGDARVALNLALARIATGEWGAARAVLDENAAIIPAADRGLALALAGEPQQGVTVLLAAMRVPGADARTRQNLALALALAGEWSDAHMLISLDLDPKAARGRVLEWMRFAQPRAAADQVAALLRITPAADPGQPVALALGRAATAPAAAAP